MFGKALRKIADGLAGIERLDEDSLKQLETILLSADMGLDATDLIIANLRAKKLKKGDALHALLAAEVEAILAPQAQPLVLAETPRPFVILLAGVNGTGKTTSIGKLARVFIAQGKSVMLVACDTFRAAATEQLTIWGERVGARVATAPPKSDSAGLAFTALEQARTENIDVVLIDTAGRLQSNEALMAELEKLIRVMRKIDAQAPHASLLVLDASTGQNAIAQADAFRKSAETTGLIMTKLDGTARGGALVAIAHKLALPIHFVGTGESVQDLHIFDAGAFAHALTDPNAHQ